MRSFLNLLLSLVTCVSILVSNKWQTGRFFFKSSESQEETASSNIYFVNIREQRILLFDTLIFISETSNTTNVFLNRPPQLFFRKISESGLFLRFKLFK